MEACATVTAQPLVTPVGNEHCTRFRLIWYPASVTGLLLATIAGRGNGKSVGYCSTGSCGSKSDKKKWADEKQECVTDREGHGRRQSRPAVRPTQYPLQWVPGPFPGDTAAGAWRWPPPYPSPSSAEVTEIVQLYLYTLFGPSRPCKVNFYGTRLFPVHYWRYNVGIYHKIFTRSYNSLQSRENGYWP